MKRTICICDRCRIEVVLGAGIMGEPKGWDYLTVQRGDNSPVSAPRAPALSFLFCVACLKAHKIFLRGDQ